MAYSLPNFNLALAVWRSGNAPFADPPDIEDLVCQLYVLNRHNQDMVPNDSNSYVPPIIIRTPTGFQPIGGDIYGVANNTITYYAHRWGHLIHQGFPNEYWDIIVEMCTNDGTRGVEQQQL